VTSKSRYPRHVSRSRPFIISIVGYLELIAGFIGIVYAAILFFGLWITGAFAGGFLNGLIIGGFALILALITLAIGRGLLMGRGWAWEFAIYISILNIIVGIIQISGAAVPTIHFGVVGVGGFTGFGTILICAVALYYLSRPNVRAFFRR
jgi:hypothetical protein